MVTHYPTCWDANPSSKTLELRRTLPPPLPETLNHREQTKTKSEVMRLQISNIHIFLMYHLPPLPEYKHFVDSRASYWNLMIDKLTHPFPRVPLCPVAPGKSTSHLPNLSLGTPQTGNFSISENSAWKQRALKSGLLESAVHWMCKE